MQQCEKIKEGVTNFRMAMEKPEVKNGYLFFQEFPSGACRDVSILLGVYLTEQGFGDFQYTLAENFTGQTHSWLEDDRYLIDITADQFPNISEKVILIEKPAINKNHLGFVVSRRKPAKLDELVGICFINLLNTYKAIKAEMARY